MSVTAGASKYFKMPTTTEVNDSAFKIQVLTAPQSEAVRADFLAYNQRAGDAQTLLDQVLHEDPNNVSAYETKGFLEFQQRHFEEARKWYAKAVHLDSQSYLAHYYFALIALSGSQDSEQEQVESSLRTAIRLNPQFAPAFDRLAVSLAMRHKNLDEAHMMGLTAVSLEPSNVGYRINVANVLMRMEQGQNAVTVLKSAAKLAKTPEEIQEVNNSLANAQAYMEAQSKVAETNQHMSEEEKGAGPGQPTPDVPLPHLKQRPEFVAKGPHRFLVGVLQSVHCDSPALDLTVNASGKLVPLHIDNYYKIPFSAMGFTPSSELNPCKDLENKPAKVEYVESASPSHSAQLISVELHK